LGAGCFLLLGKRTGLGGKAHSRPYLITGWFMVPGQRWFLSSDLSKFWRAGDCGPLRVTFR